MLKVNQYVSVVSQAYDIVKDHFNNAQSVQKAEDGKRALVRELQNDSYIKVPFVGDFNAGKSSLIISSRARDKRKEVESKVRDLLAAFVADIDSRANEAKNAVISVFTKRKDELIRETKNMVKDYLDNLEQELQDKERQLKIYDEAMTNLKKIEKIL